MANVWIRVTVAVLAVVVSASAVWAQDEAPQPPPEPVAPDPAMMTGPQFCPDVAGPPVISKYPFTPDSFVNGFDEPGEPACHPINHFIYGGVGAIALQRQRLGQGVVSFFDTVSGGVDNGAPLNPTDPVVARFNNVPSDFHWGVQARLGVQKGNHGLEASGFYISEQTDTSRVIGRGALNVPFGNNPFPLGFGGNNNLWRQADIVEQSLRSQLASAEVNYKRVVHPSIELLFGVRYVDQQEVYGLLTDDDGLSVSPADPFRTATYEVQTVNRIAGGQLGVNFEHYFTPGLAFGFMSKGMVGPNFYEVRNRLYRGDGFERATGNVTDTKVSGLVELNAYTNILFNEHVRLSFGYQIFWLLEVPVAHQQVNFNASQVNPPLQDQGSVFYHGPRIELGIAF